MLYQDTTGNLRYVLGSAFTSAYLNPAAFIGVIAPGTIPALANLNP